MPLSVCHLVAGLRFSNVYYQFSVFGLLAPPTYLRVYKVNESLTRGGARFLLLNGDPSAPLGIYKWNSVVESWHLVSGLYPSRYLSTKVPIHQGTYPSYIAGTPPT